MAKFIHLSLLLAATAQLLLVLVTNKNSNGEKVTLEFPSNWTIEYCCGDNKCKFLEKKKNNPKLEVSVLNIPNEECNAIYSCYGDSDPDLLLCLNITGCQNPGSSNCVVEFSDRLPSTEADCRRRCPGNPGRNNECHQCNNVEIQRHPVSGDCLSNSDSGSGNENAAGLQFHEAPKSWIDALEHCQNQDSSLAEIPNQTVQASVNSSLLNKTNSMLNGTWIGLERSIFGKNSPWKWISGAQVGDHCPWNVSYPVDALNHHCGKIIWVAELGQFKWLDACCHEELPFICQNPT